MDSQCQAALPPAIHRVSAGRTQRMEDHVQVLQAAPSDPVAALVILWDVEEYISRAAR